MGLAELFVLALGLSADAFSVSVCKGLASRKMNWRNAFLCGLYFGVFQALMPTIGYLIGYRFKDYITSIDHWIAFVLLGFIGVNMIRESRSENDECPECEQESNAGMDVKTMLTLAVATSIDALTVGISFAFLNVNIVAAVSFIGVCTFVLSFFGVWVGNVFGSRFRSKAELAGGIILILIGTKILIEHLLG